MKNRRKLNTIVFIAELALLAACSKTPSNPNNPQEKDLPGKDFCLTLCDEQKGACKDSVYYFYADVNSDITDAKASYTRVGSKGSDRLFNVEPDEVEIVQTPCNTIRFESTESVNGASGGLCVDIVRDTDRDYHLVFRSEGEADITLWNGSGEQRRQKVIRVKARESIPCEGILIRLDGKDFLLRRGVWESITGMGLENWVGTHPVICDSWKNMGDYPLIYRLRTSFKGLLHTLPLCKNPSYRQDDPDSYGIVSSDWDDWYGYWSVYDSSERLFERERMTSYEIVGTVPRNATPDCDLTLIADPVCTNQTRSNLCEKDRSGNYYATANNILNYYEFNSKHNTEFRWMHPIGERWCFNTIAAVDEGANFEEIEFTGPDADRYRDFRDGKYAQKLNPSDIRYRKALIWNRFLLPSIYPTDPVDYIGYSFLTGGQKTFWWAIIKTYNQEDGTWPEDDRKWAEFNTVREVFLKEPSGKDRILHDWFFSMPYWFSGEKPYWEKWKMQKGSRK